MSENNPRTVQSAASDPKARTWIAAFLLSFLVTACSTPGWEVERPSEGVVVGAAESAFARGEYADAAAAWESEAMTAPPGHARHDRGGGGERRYREAAVAHARHHPDRGTRQRPDEQSAHPAAASECGGRMAAGG